MNKPAAALRDQNLVKGGKPTEAPGIDKHKEKNKTGECTEWVAEKASEDLPRSHRRKAPGENTDPARPGQRH